MSVPSTDGKAKTAGKMLERNPVNDYPKATIIKTPPNVFVIGWSHFYWPGVEDYAIHRRTSWGRWNDGRESTEDMMLEVCGRICYASLPNERGVPTFDYLQNSIVKHNHESVIEHSTINFLVADLPRSVLMELSRHRVGTAMSWESTRFTFDHLRLVMPPLIRLQTERQQDQWRQRAEQGVNNFYRQLDDLGYNPGLKRKERKRIVEAARGHLPNEQGSDGVWTVNLRQLRHVMLLRSHPDADLSFREFVCQLWEPASTLFPSVFADLEMTMSDDGFNQIVRKS